MPSTSRLGTRMAFPSIGSLLLCSLAVTAEATECGCKTIAAQSFSDSGQCVVDETATGFCTLDWRHDSEQEESNPEETARAEAGARAFAKYSLSGQLSSESALASETLWSQLESFSKSGFDSSIYKGAASYFDQTVPKYYDEPLALASIAALLGSSTAGDKSAPDMVLKYLSAEASEVYGRITGRDFSEPNIKETPSGIVADHSSYGCFEIRFLKDGSTDPFGPFERRLGVRTAYAEDPNCLTR